MLAERSDSRLAQLVAGKVFLVRVANAMLALVSQVLLARWMGSFEFGIFIGSSWKKVGKRDGMMSM